MKKITIKLHGLEHVILNAVLSCTSLKGITLSDLFNIVNNVREIALTEFFGLVAEVKFISTALGQLLITKKPEKNESWKETKVLLNPNLESCLLNIQDSDQSNNKNSEVI
jgi:hypothetical protein